MPSTIPNDLGSFGRTHVFLVDDIVVKCDDRLGTLSMVRERAALELLAGAGLPVPPLVAWGEFDDTRRWVVVGRLDGEPPEDAAQPAHEVSVNLGFQLGAIAARLHAAATPPGFGTWAVHERSLVDEVRLRMDALTDMAHRAEIVPRADIDTTVQLMNETIDALADRETPVLAHRDLQPRNVLVIDGRVSALLDFESSGGSDPAEDFKVIGLDWSAPGFAAFRDGYAAAGGTLGPDGPHRVAHHVLDWALVVFAYLGGIAPVYLPAARTAVERIRSGERPDLDNRQTTTSF
jgi:aminoglycoside phosphotransferase (APT) family kinase protein